MMRIVVVVQMVMVVMTWMKCSRTTGSSNVSTSCSSRVIVIRGTPWGSLWRWLTCYTHGTTTATISMRDF